MDRDQMDIWSIDHLKTVVDRRLGVLVTQAETTPEVLSAAGVAPTARAEELGLEEWAAVARCAAEAA